ncbi:MAG: hypothetical protein CUN56_06120 [Phototrophicales bacterium]|nr:MAG: hypothetical protein CUN56_06120 [Phototrophicales bacterium]RMG78025.1 MAG: PAS domain S-box protein [Chloroflexota bacterium]
MDKIIVLLICRDPQLQPIVEQVTQANNYTLQCHEDLSISLQDHSPDLLITDDMAICQQLQQQGQTIPSLMLIEQEDDATLETLYQMNVTDYLVLPLRPAVLKYKLRQLVKMSVRRSQREAEMTRIKENLQLALEASQVGIWNWDMVTDEAYFSPGWMTMLGYEPDEFAHTGENWMKLIHPDDVARVKQALQDHIERDMPYVVDHRLRGKDGTYRWIRARGRVMMRDVDGMPRRMAGTHRDVTEAHQMRDALEKSEERHRIISNTISDYAYSYIVQPDGTLKKDWSTQAFHDITGFTFEEMDQDGWMRLIHPDDIPIAQARMQRLFQGMVDISEFRIVTKSGEIRWLRDHGHPIIDPETGRVVHIYGAAQDITHRKQSEEKLQQYMQELQARNEELDAFAYTVAHDLKNPIAGMMGFASLIKNYYSRMSEEQILGYIDLILEGGYKLREIIDALLLLAGVNKIDQPEVTELDMHMIVADCQRRLLPMIQETQADIQIVVDDFPPVMGYTPWVEEVWMNYLSNALKYGGQPPKIDIGADAPKNGMVRFWVRDNGRGLTPDEQQRVFTPFTRLNQVKVEGHGLGLSIVQRIVNKLGGEVGVESVIGQGSTFSFTLPVSSS